MASVRDSKQPTATPGKTAASARTQRLSERQDKGQKEHRRRRPVPVRTAGPQTEPSQRRLNLPVIFWLVILHLGVLAAPFTFTWQGLVALLALHWFTGSIGICLGYHRMLTHHSFETYRPVRWIISLIGTAAGEGPPTSWVADHRKHHAHSDQEGDPHSPHDGPWWSHVFWLAWTGDSPTNRAHRQRWAPDLVKDRGIQVLDALFLPLHFVMGAALFAGGYLVGGMPLAVSLLVWGLFLRVVLVLHATWMVNSVSHIWGYRNYATTDDSRNNWLVALVAYGEGWHNNHHAYPRMARHGHRWWEIDVTFLAIRLLERVGLVWKVVDYKQRQLADRPPSDAP